MAEIQGSSKQALLIEMISRPEGITIAEAVKATGWQAHTVRGTISGVLKRKLGLEVLKSRDTSGACVYRLELSQVALIRHRSSHSASAGRGIGSNMPERKYATIPVPATTSSAILENVLAVDNRTEEQAENYTVANAITDYMAHYSKEGKGVSVANNIIKSRILPKLGDIKVKELTTKIIASWHYELSKEPAYLRTKNGSLNRNVRPIGDDPESIRCRRATANRVLSVLKAALNYVWREGNVDSDLAWRRVKPFRSVGAPVIRYLNKDECQRLVQACEADLRLIVQAALFSGCRYGEICRLVAGDYRADTGTLYIHITKNGQPRHVVLTDEGKEFFESVIKGKLASDRMFKTKDGQPWGKSLQSRRIRDACRKAEIEPEITYHILRHTYGSLLAMQGVPMTVVARQLGHANTQVTEKHYAHISPSYVAQMVRDNFPVLKIV